MKAILLKSFMLLSILPFSRCSFFNKTNEPNNDEPQQVIPVEVPEEEEQEEEQEEQEEQEHIDFIDKTEISQTYKDIEDASCPSKGNVKVAIIPLWFKDSSNYIATTEKSNMANAIYDGFFGDGDNLNYYSLSEYYSIESNGTLNLTGKMSNWYEINKNSSVYYNDYYSILSLIFTLTDWFFEQNPDENRLDYDSDHDGYLDCVSVIYAAPDYSTAGRSEDYMWAFEANLAEPSNKDVNNPALSCFFWASYDFFVKNNDYEHIETETVIHEFGHTFGLQDYYDYNGQYAPAGGFSMQDYAQGGHDPFSMMALGWINPYIPTESLTLKIGAFQSTREVILLTPEWNEYDSPFDEYLLLELYTPTGLNEYYSSMYFSSNVMGIRLWHVDARIFAYTKLYPKVDGYFTANARDEHKNKTVAMTNTSYKANSEANAYLSPLGSDYYNYNLLQYIEPDSLQVGPDKDAAYLDGTLNMQRKYLAGTSFSFNHAIGDAVYFDDLGKVYFNYDCSKQFENKGKLNSGSNLGWSFAIENIVGLGDEATATIHLIKD